MLACWLLPVVVAPSQPPPASPKPANSHEQPSLAHETLEYAVEWRLINAGRMKLSTGPAPASEKAEVETKLHLESIGLVSRLFHVSDDYTVEMDNSFCAQSTFMTAHEGSRNRETKVVYDHSARKTVYREKDLSKNTVINAETEIPACVSDIVGGLQKLRTLNLEPGKSTQLPISDGKKSVMIKVECQRREEVKTATGLHKALVYEVYAFNNVLYRRPGRIHVWLTDDAEKVPVQIQIRLQFTIGTIILRLDKEEKT